MLLSNLKTLKDSSKMTYEQIADKSKTPVGTVKHIFSGKFEPLASTLYRVVTAMGGSLDEVLADTNIVLSPKTLAEVKEDADAVQEKLNSTVAELDAIKAERDLLIAENKALTSSVHALTAENQVLQVKIELKDEIIATHVMYQTKGK